MFEMNKNLFLLAMVLLFTACSTKDLPEEEPVEKEDTVALTCFPDAAVSADQLEQDPLPIVRGKILSWAVSTDDEIAYAPPGKWVNIYGKTYYRYVERADGAALKVNEMAASATNILTTEQISLITKIVSDQTKNELQLIANRATISRELIKFRKKENADETLIQKLAQNNGFLLAELIKQSGATYGEIFKSLTNSQKNAMCEKRKIADHANSNTDILSALGKSLTSDENTVLKALLSDFFIWATGSEEMNKYVDAGRAAVFFGFANLRVEDRAGTDVSKGLRSEASNIIEKLLNNNQTARLNKLITEQENSLSTYFTSRADLAHEVMAFQSENLSVDLDKISNISLHSEMVEADLAIIQAKAMAEIIQSFSDEQMQVLLDFKAGNGN